VVIVEFLVSIRVELPAEFDDERRAALLAAEAARAAELAAAGRLVRLWRVPGRLANRGIWEAADATVLHAALTSLPLWPWMEIDVEPLACHPSDPLARARDGDESLSRDVRKQRSRSGSQRATA